MDSPELMTAQQLLVSDVRGKRAALFRGRIFLRDPRTYRQGVIAARVLSRIDAFLEHDRATRAAAHPLGEVLGADTGFILERDPDTVQAPDVAFVKWERRPTERTGFAELAPDLVVEIMSPNDTGESVATRMAHWLLAGTPLVWVIDPILRHAHACHLEHGMLLWQDHEALDGESTLPGFVLPLRELFA